MHNKFCLIDAASSSNRMVISGSSNWTHSVCYGSFELVFSLFEFNIKFLLFFSRASDPTAKMSHLFQINEFTMNMPMHLKIYGTKLHRQSIWARSLHTNRRQTMAQRHSIYQRRDVLLYSRRMALRLVWFVKINSTLNIFHLQNQFTINCTVD